MSIEELLQQARVLRGEHANPQRREFFNQGEALDSVRDRRTRTRQMREHSGLMYDAAQERIELAEREGRDLTAAEQADCTTLFAEIDKLQKVAAEQEAALDAEIGGDVFNPFNPWASSQLRPRRSDGGDEKPGMVKATGLKFRDGAGREVRAHRAGERLGPDNPNINIGRCFQAYLTGRTDILNAAEIRAMHGGSDSQGGFLVSPEMSRMLIDLARANSVTQRAGVQTVGMNTSELIIAEVLSDPTITWRSETVTVPASSITFGRKTLRARTGACLVGVSVELLEDAENAADVITQIIGAAAGVAIDQAVLIGTGAESQPLGIRNHASVNEVASVGTPTDYSHVSTAVSKIIQANYNGEIENLAWVSHPLDAAVMDNLTDTTGQPKQPTPWASKLQKLHTTSLPTTEGGGSDESVGIVGDFSQVLLGMRTEGMRFEVLPAGTYTDPVTGATMNAVTDLMRIIRMYFRMDVAILRPTWLTNMTGITTS